MHLCGSPPQPRRRWQALAAACRFTPPRPLPTWPTKPVLRINCDTASPVSGPSPGLPHTPRPHDKLRAPNGDQPSPPAEPSPPPAEPGPSPQNRTSPAHPQSKARAPAEQGPRTRRARPALRRASAAARHAAGPGGRPPGNTEARQGRAKIRATPGGYGGKPPGVAIIGVPTGARNAGSGALTGDQSTDMNATRKHPLVCQDPIATRSREGG